MIFMEMVIVNDNDVLVPQCRIQRVSARKLVGKVKQRDAAKVMAAISAFSAVSAFLPYVYENIL